MGHLQGGAHIRSDLLQGSCHLGRSDAQVVDLGAVEPGSELPQSGVTARPHVGQQSPHLVDGRVDLGLGPGQPGAQVSAHTPEVESPQHGARLRGPPERSETGLLTGHTGAMSLDVAQLSSLSTALDDLTQRIATFADALDGAPREDVAADLYEVERNLQAAARRLRTLLGKL